MRLNLLVNSVQNDITLSKTRRGLVNAVGILSRGVDQIGVFYSPGVVQGDTVDVNVIRMII